MAIHTIANGYANWRLGYVRWHDLRKIRKIQSRFVMAVPTPITKIFKCLKMAVSHLAQLWRRPVFKQSLRALDANTPMECETLESWNSRTLIFSSLILEWREIQELDDFWWNHNVSSSWTALKLPLWPVWESILILKFTLMVDWKAV